jgi:hypothetical protein
LKTVVGDDHDAIAVVLRSALLRSDIIIFSGGGADRRHQYAPPSLHFSAPLHLDDGILETLRRRVHRAVSNSQNQ